ncbi:hypothetical protein [Tortoise microvirus 2]|nr:hypothetical protein [Tortoise microvirus 2]QCS37429.1 hypothetical protein [Tortoise microvirus 2]QPB07427.1 MAG: hypothetical protein [Microvirus sp.]
MKRLSHIGNVLNPPETIDYVNFYPEEYDPSVTDKSYFIPLSESVKTVNPSVLSASEIESSFDFKDGVDSGMKIPVDRYKGLDLAEVSQHTRKLHEQLEAQAKSDAEKAKTKKDIQDIYVKANAAPTPAPTANE